MLEERKKGGLGVLERVVESVGSVGTLILTLIC
jgi:hypothetical protein